ncbi:hypothetical protein LCGC14_0877770 [marine sediment metagenome]|uniref:Uncharacterized protein n=1 Tax=marine sediment metagenome TaxID=412755 RepID=A0A0F9PNF6_9ZZZZ
MSPKWLIFLLTVWVFGGVFGLILEGGYLGDDQGSVINVLLNSKVITATGVLGKIAGVFTDTAMWGAIGSLLVWDFAFWEGSLEIVRWIIFIPVTIAMLFSMLMAWIRGVSSA